jgi:hypothetical protein
VSSGINEGAIRQHKPKKVVLFHSAGVVLAAIKALGAI